jgi:type I restriction enzyme S subunit
MAGDAHRTTVGDYVTLVRGTTYKGQLVGESGPALLGLGSIEPGGGFRIGSYKTYGGDCPAELMLFPGDIYASLKGATKDGKMIGSVARVPPSVPTGRLTQDTVKLVLRNPNPEDASYLHWILRTPQYREYCAGHAMGSAVVALSRHDFLAYPVPSPTTQRRTAVVLLDAIEERVEVNRQMNETLEAMARALFKSWFVDFDPVRAKSEGRDPGLPQPLADLFPDSFEDSELGEIPKGWEVRGLDKIARFLNGLALQKYPPKGGRSLPVIKIAQLRAGNTAGADLASANLETDYVVEDGDVLFSWSGSLECVLWTGGQGALNQHLFKATSDEFPKWFYYLWIHQHLADFRHIAAGKATTMGHIQRHHLSDAKVVVPAGDTMKAVNDALSPLVDKFIATRIESRTLAALRDALLPQLISGMLRVKDAEQMAEIS